VSKRTHRRLSLVAVLVSGLLLSFATQPVVSQTTRSTTTPPPEAARLRTADLRHLPKLAKQFAHHKDGLSQQIWTQLSPGTKQVLSDYLAQPAANDYTLRRVLVADLNRLIDMPTFSQLPAFGTMRLRGTTRRLFQSTSTAQSRLPLNRALLENWYRGRIAVSPVGKVFQDDADEAQDKADAEQDEADQTQDQADQQQAEADQAEKQADEEQTSQQQEAADQAQDKADEAQQAADQAQGEAEEAQSVASSEKGWTWGEFAGWAVGGAAGGAVSGGLAGGLAGAAAGAAGGFVGGALGYALAYWWGNLVDHLPGLLPSRALDGPLLDGHRSR